MDLSGNTILITGGSSGIGLAFARKFVELGNQVIVTGRNQSKLDRLKQSDPQLEIAQCDVADPAAILRLRDDLRQKFPALNVLMNNAGIFTYFNVTRTDDELEKLTTEVDINVSGVIRTTSAFMDQINVNNGTILNVSSGLAFVPIHCAPVYCATKAAIHSYTISLRQQLSDSGVEVIELMPPAVKTELTSDLPEDAGFTIITTDELVEATVKGLGAGSLEIRPGQANQLHWMSRIAPGFIQRQLEKGSKALIPK